MTVLNRPNIGTTDVPAIDWHCPMEISGSSEMVYLWLIVGIFFGRTFRLQFLISVAVTRDLHSCFKNQPYAMSSNEGASILDEALACISQRIASILIQPAEKEQNYIASLHNEVVGIP